MRKEVTMRTDINGVIIAGQVYEAVESNQYGCNGCALKGECSYSLTKSNPCDIFDGLGKYIFILSSELTDKLNHWNGKE